MALFADGDDDINLSVDVGASSVSAAAGSLHGLPQHALTPSALAALQPSPPTNLGAASDAVDGVTEFSAALLSPGAAAAANQLAFLSSALSAAGLSTRDFPAALERSDVLTAPMTEEAFVGFVAGLGALWSERQRSMQACTSAQGELERVRSELGHAQARLAVLKDEKAEADKRAWEGEMKRRSQERDALAREKALKADLAALDKKCTMIQRRDNQYKHELRKFEQANEKMQEKLAKYIVDKSSSSNPNSGNTIKGAVGSSSGGLDLSATLSKTTGLRGLVGGSGTGGGLGRTQASSASSSSSSGASNSNADVELLQSTLSTYSERMNELVGENLALKNALRNLEAEMQAALNEQQQADEQQQQAEDAAQTVSDPLHPFVASTAPRVARPLSPTTLSLLADFNPSSIDLPWELAGEQVEKVLRAKIALLREGVSAAREQRLAASAAAEEEGLLEALKAKLGEQALIIREQDQLLQQVLHAEDASNASLEAEAREQRRLSLRAEADDLARRQRATQENTSALLLQSASKHNRQPSWAASPASLRILGGHTSSNLPVFATPAFLRKHSAKDAAAGAAGTSAATSSTAAATAASASSSAAVPIAGSSATKSKWLLGGVVSTPVFTPSKRSGMLASSTAHMRAGSTDLGRGGLAEDDDASSIGDFNPDDEDYLAGDSRAQSRAHSPIRALDALDENGSASATNTAPATPQRQ